MKAITKIIKDNCNMIMKDADRIASFAINHNKKESWDTFCERALKYVHCQKEYCKTRTQRKYLNDLEYCILFRSMEVNNHFGTYEKTTIF